MEKFLKTFSPIARPVIPVLIGVLGTLVAMSFPTYHTAFCSGVL